MNGSETLLKPADCVMLLVDLRAGLGFGTESISRQVLLNNAVALAKTGAAFGVPVIATTSASKVYSGPLFPQVQAVLPDVKAIRAPKHERVGRRYRARSRSGHEPKSDFWWPVC